MTYDADTCRTWSLDDDDRTTASPIRTTRDHVRDVASTAGAARRMAGSRARADRLASAVGDVAGRAARALRRSTFASVASAVGSDDLPPGPRGEGEPDPARNPGDLGERIRRSGPSSDRVFDDTDRELPSDRDFEGGDAPFGEGGQLPLGTPPLEPGQI